MLNYEVTTAIIKIQAFEKRMKIINHKNRINPKKVINLIDLQNQRRKNNGMKMHLKISK